MQRLYNLKLNSQNKISNSFSPLIWLPTNKTGQVIIEFISIIEYFTIIKYERKEGIYF